MSASSVFKREYRAENSPRQLLWFQAKPALVLEGINYNILIYKHRIYDDDISLEMDLFINFVFNYYSLHLNTFTWGSWYTLSAFRYVQNTMWGWGLLEGLCYILIPWEHTAWCMHTEYSCERGTEFYDIELHCCMRTALKALVGCKRSIS